MKSTFSFQEFARKKYEEVPKDRYLHALIEKTLSAISETPPFTYPSVMDNALVFFDGVYVPEASTVHENDLLDAPISCLSFEEAKELYGDFALRKAYNAVERTQNPSALFSAGTAKDPLFIRVEDGQKTDLHLVYLHSSQEKLCPQFLYFSLGKDADVSVQTKQIFLEDSASYAAPFVSLFLDASAKISWSDVISTHFTGAFQAQLSEGAFLQKQSVHLGSTSSREEIEIALLGKNADASVSSLILNEGNLEKRLNILMEHQSPEAVSSQLVKTLAAGSSKTAFAGKIYVHPEAQQTESYQLARALLLSEKARMQAMPNLEIFADDVKASHGATIAEPDEKALFYLQSRGISQASAKALLMQAFCREVIEKFPKDLAKTALSHTQNFIEKHL